MRRGDKPKRCFRSDSYTVRFLYIEIPDCNRIHKNCKLQLRIFKFRNADQNANQTLVATGNLPVRVAITRKTLESRFTNCKLERLIQLTRLTELCSLPLDVFTFRDSSRFFQLSSAFWSLLRASTSCLLNGTFWVALQLGYCHQKAAAKFVVQTSCYNAGIMMVHQSLVTSVQRERCDGIPGLGTRPIASQR